MTERHDGEDPPVIEGEFHEDTPHSADKSGQGPRSSGRRAVAFLPWFLLLLLLSFIGGLFAMPYVERQMVAWGMMEPRPANSMARMAQDETARAQLADLSRAQQDLMGRLKIVEVAARQLGEESTATLSRLDRLGDDLADMSARLDVAQAMPDAAQGGAEEGVSAGAAAGIVQEMASLRDRMAALEAAMSQNQDGAGTAPLGQFNAINDALAAARTERRGLDQRLEGLTSRMASLEAVDRGVTMMTPGLAGSLLAIGRRVDTGQPYAGPLADLRAALVDKPPLMRLGAAQPLAILAPHAAKGLPGMDRLTKDFAALAGDVQRALLSGALGQTQDKAGEPGVLTWLKNLVVVRPADPKDGSDGAAQVSQMEALLEAGDLEGAVALAEALPDAARAVLVGWLGAAHEQLKAKAAFQQLLTLLGSTQLRIGLSRPPMHRKRAVPRHDPPFDICAVDRGSGLWRGVVCR